MSATAITGAMRCTAHRRRRIAEGARPRLGVSETYAGPWLLIGRARPLYSKVVASDRARPERNRSMTKDELIRVILKECRAPSRSVRSGIGDLATRSPAAGGGLAGAAPVRPGTRRGALTNPQTGDTRPFRRSRPRTARHR